MKAGVLHKLFFPVIILFLLTAFTTSTSGWKKIYTIKVTADFVTTDNIGNLYVVKNDEMKKYNPAGELLRTYSNKKLGKIFSVDASTPLRILLYYKDFSVLVILDSQLTQNGENITLETMELEQSDLACTSFQNGIWLYNRQNAELVRLDESLKKVVSTGNLNRILNTELHPNFMTEYNGYLYLNNPQKGILVFDIYGTYSKTISLKGLTQFQLSENDLIYFLNGKLKNFMPQYGAQVEMEIPDTLASGCRLNNEKYFLQYKDSVCAYMMKSTK